MAELLKDLLERCKRKEPEAVRILIERFAPAAHDLARVLLQDQHLAEDAVQDALVMAIARLDQLKQPEAFAAWLRQIVRSQAVRIVRQRRERIGPVTDNAAAGPAPDDAMQRQEISRLVHKAMARISPLGRQTATLFYFEDRSVADIARTLQVPEGTVKRRLHEARQQMRSILLGYFADTQESAMPQPPDKPLLF